MLAAPNTPNFKAPSCFATSGGLNADHTRLTRAAILSRVLMRELLTKDELSIDWELERAEDVCPAHL